MKTTGQGLLKKPAVYGGFVFRPNRRTTVFGATGALQGHKTRGVFPAQSKSPPGLKEIAVVAIEEIIGLFGDSKRWTEPIIKQSVVTLIFEFEFNFYFIVHHMVPKTTEAASRRPLLSKILFESPG